MHCAALFRDFDTRPDSTFSTPQFDSCHFLHCHTFPCSLYPRLNSGFIRQVQKKTQEGGNRVICKDANCCRSRGGQSQSENRGKSLRGKGDLIFRRNCDVCLHRTHRWNIQHVVLVTLGFSYSTIQHHTTRSLIVAVNESRILTWRD